MSAQAVEVTRAFIQRDINDLAMVYFTPTPVEYSGWKIMLTFAWSYAVNGPYGYVTGHGRIIKKDGTLGVRQLEVPQNVVPIEARRALFALLEEQK